METEKCQDCIEHRQLELIQRIGRIGYWEYALEDKSIALTEPSLSLLSTIAGISCSGSRSLMEALNDAERKRFQTTLDQAVIKRLPFNIELKLANGDSKAAYIVVRGAPVEPGPGLPDFAGTFQDVTSEKNRDADHEKVNTQLQALLDALPQGVSVVDKDLRLTLWNRSFHEILGFPQNMVFKHASFEDLIQFNATRGEYGPGDPEEQVKTIINRVREFLPHRFERQLTGGRTVLVEGFPFRSGSEVSGFVTTYTDITDQKLTEEQLTRQRDVMKTIIDNFPGAISLCDTDLRFTAYNEQFIELLEFPPSLFAKGWVHLEDLSRFNAERGEYGPGDPEEQVRAMVLRARNFQAHRIERMRPNGQWLEIRGTPIPSGGFVTSYIDITERKLIEAELLHAKEVAEARREQVASLLNNSGQGFLSFSNDLIVDEECSQACVAMLGESPAGKNAAKVFFPNDTASEEMVCTTIAAVLAESDSCIQESMLSLLPKEIQRDGVLLKAEYKTLDNGKFMVVLTNITSERRMAALLDRERLRLELIVAAVSDSRNFFDTINGFREFLAQDLPRMLEDAVAPQVIAKELYREIHTYKGLLSQFSFPNTPGLLHVLESGLSDALSLGERLRVQEIVELLSPETLQATFHEDLAILSEALGEEFLAHGESFILSSEQALQLEKLSTRLLHGEKIDTSVAETRRLLEKVGTLRKISFRSVLMGFDGLVSQAAIRMEKEVSPIVVNGGSDIWIDPNAYRPFLRALVHVFRNAVAHGIEMPEERWEAGKEEAGTITCNVAVAGRNIRLSIADNGGGINLEKLRQQAVGAGIYDASNVQAVPDDEIVRLIFMDSISTQKEVTALAGRGVGLAAVLSETISMGGEVVVRTVAGQGTEFLFVLPLDQENLSEGVEPCQMEN